MKRYVALLALAGLGAAGCNFHGAYSLPLPGGASHGKQVVVKAIFNDVEDLVPDAAVRINDVAEGQVTNIALTPDKRHAEVTLSVNASAASGLPYNSVATLAQTTLLGEKYVALGPPPGNSGYGHLQNGEVLPRSRTDILPDVEQVFAVLATVLNGGDLQDLRTINVEITKALHGRETQVRAALSRIKTFVADLDTQRHQIVRALDGLNRLSGVLANQTSEIQTALTQLGPGLKVLADTTPQFVRLLHGLSRFGVVAKHLITASRKNTVANLRYLQPILRHLAAAGSNVPHALEILVTYPFPRNDQVDTPGDFSGLNLTYCPQATKSRCTFTSGAGPLTLVCALLTSLNLAAIDQACPSNAAVSRPLHHGSARRHGSKGTSPGGGLPSLPVPSLPAVPTPSPSDSGLLGLLGGLTGGHR